MARTRIIALAAIAAIASAAALWAQGAPVVAEQNDIRLSVLIKGDTAEVTVSAPGTGWVAVGFNPSSRMKDANFLIGYVKDGTAFARDDFGVSNTSHKADEELGGKNNLISFSGTEANGVTTMTFVVPRDSGDSKDSKLGPGQHTVILGYSNADNFTGFHKKVGKTTIVLP